MRSIITLIFINSIFWQSNSLSAKVMPPVKTSKLSLGVANLWIQNSDKDREPRNSFDISFTEDLHKYFSLGASVNIAPDFLDKSQEVNIYQDFYTFLAEASASYIFLVRFKASAGVGLSHQRTRYRFYDIKEDLVNNTPVFSLAGSIDYSFNSNWELGFIFKNYERFDQDLRDWSYGININYNIDHK